MRDNNEQQTVADAIDFDTYDADHDPDLLGSVRRLLPGLRRRGCDG